MCDGFCSPPTFPLWLLAADVAALATMWMGGHLLHPRTLGWAQIAAGALTCALVFDVYVVGF